ncbi:arginine decarboxylase [Enterovibrio norvegicus FF-33]|uniref:Arginine decarboxylase n=1 Tax=Enterovibrio norvegicus FF-454 TaxID=1185651 RepID=A0A1E5C2I0_9GAMM|nr:arginine decarboxylase [Enterovibrio norvegicus]OEE59716.1 arginine decarboxylase [Enterovibrio norvegicus FF-454]OEE70192.1 arginine decarboxylase [Enterovibrio norvegicus FF-33]OEE90023.1 arginine decarboxylase [Enterovibrio norvegicus FF-162]
MKTYGKKFNVLILEEAHREGVVGNAIERLIAELENSGARVMVANSFDDCYSMINSNTALDCLMLTSAMSGSQSEENERFYVLIEKLNKRQQNVPVFLLAERKKITLHVTREMMENVDEFAWILEDTPDFIAGRAVAAITRYRAQLLPPLMAALMNYDDIHEYSWAAPGHQGGVGFTKTPAGQRFYNYYGEGLFRTDMGIERGSLGSLLDHTGSFGESERYAARVFGAHQSYSLVTGTSGSNRTIMSACMKANDLVICDRNCHKSIEQGLMISGARPVYLVPTRNRYGIIGPIFPDQLSKSVLQQRAKAEPLTKDYADQRAVYAVLTNCTYDGLCYNAKKAQDILAESSDRIHFDEAWYGYARFNPIYEDHFAMRGDPVEDPDGPTVFATHSTHKLLNALSQASFLHVRNGKGAISFERFNQAYMMHATTSPLYAICASNDIAASMMDGNRGHSLTLEVIREAVDFRQAMGRLNREFNQDGDWFFKPWNAETVKDPVSGQSYAFEDAPADLLCENQDAWVMHPNDNWHGFKDMPADWCMLDPIKVSILAPGMGDDGHLLDAGVPAALVTLYLGRFGIVPTRTTDFQVMFLFSMGITKGKWATLVNTLMAFKRHYDDNTPLEEALPDLVADFPDFYGNMGLKELGDKIFGYLKQHNPGEVLNAAYETLPEAVMTPHAAFEAIVADNVEMVPSSQLVGRVAANAVIPYPPGIPMLMSGESFGDETSPQIKYLKSLEVWDEEFPGFEKETEGTELHDGIYHVMCVKNV